MKLKLKTLTPVQIGSGDILSPYHDYIYDRDRIYYIDYKELEKYLSAEAESEKLMDQFVELVSSQAGKNKQDRFLLKNFFASNDLNFEDFSQNQIEVTDKITNEIKRTILSGTRPYIPGSSLKGAVRTALLYNHLLAGYNLKKMKGGKQAYIGQDQFGKFAGDKLKYLAVSDSSLLTMDSITLLETYRYNLKELTTDIPVVREVISIGEEMEISLQGKAPADIDSKFSYLKEGEESKILEMINAFTIKILDNELEILEQHNNGKLDNIISKYSQLYNRAEELKESKKGAILRLGAGKTYFDNTIALALDKGDYNKIKPSSDETFPVTRNVIKEGREITGTMGWILLHYWL
ncbi:MAG: type III-A CRISPR-associated RAMP protein Csm5 [bacterium]